MGDMSGDRRRTTGALGEMLAADHLARAGYRILERNFRTRAGELDLVALDRRGLVFCEVKTRVRGTTAGPDGPLDAIGAVKRHRLRTMAKEWLCSPAARGRRRPGQDIRFDAIGVVLDEDGELLALEHVVDAF